MRCKIRNKKCRRKAVKFRSHDADGYYVAENGVGDGSPSNPMSPADFLLVVLVDNNLVFFNRGDQF